MTAFRARGFNRNGGIGAHAMPWNAPSEPIAHRCERETCARGNAPCSESFDPKGKNLSDGALTVHAVTAE